MGEDHDRALGRAARTLRNHRLQGLLVIDRLRPHLPHTHREPAPGHPPEPFDRVRDPLRQAFVAGAARAALGEFGGQLLRFGQRLLAVERVRGER